MPVKKPKGPAIDREKKHIIGQIRAAMKHMEYTEDELSKELGVSKQVLSSRLVGKYEFTLPELILICDLLGIEIII